ncbi:MAG: MFS transporter [Promethearchaeota archaeon]
MEESKGPNLDVGAVEEELVSKKLSKEERRKAREKRRDEFTIPTRMTRYLWFVLLFANIVSFFDGWGSIAIMLAMSGFGETNILRAFQQIGNPDLFTYFGVSNSPILLGIILSIAGTGVVLAVSFKYLVDKYGRRPLTLITAVGFIIFAVLTSIAPPGPGGLVFFLIVRLVANYFLSGDIVVIIIAEEAPDHLRGRLIGIVLAMSSFGGVACGVIQTMKIRAPIPNPWGFDFAWGSTMTVWQSLYFLNIIGFVFIIPLFFLLKETKRFNAIKKYEDWRKKKGLKAKVGWFTPLQKKYARPMILGCLAGFLLQLVYFAQVTFFGLYFAKELKMSQELIGIVTVPIVGTAGLGAFLAGPLLDRWGRLRTVRIFSYVTFAGGTLFSFPAVFVLGDISNPFLQTLVVIGAMIGVFGLIIVSAGGMIIPLEMIPTHIRSTAMGWVSAITRGAIILAPFLMMYGAEAESAGGLSLTYQYMFVLQFISFLTAVFTIYVLAPESKGRTLEEIVSTEVYTKKEEIRDKKYKQKYHLYLISICVFIGLGFLYAQTTNGTLPNVAYMVGFYSLLSIIAFLLIYYVREKVM